MPSSGPLTTLVREERCDGCAWPETCAADRTCWREEGEAGRQAGRQAAEEPTVTAEADPVGSGKTIGQLAAEERAADLARVITVRCADCLWESTGDQVSARREWAGHRERVHEDERAVEMVERAIAGTGRRRPGAPVVGGTNQDVDANVAAVRAQGGGHGMGRGRTPKRTPEEIIEEIKAIVASEGRAPSHTNHGALAQAGAKAFGTWKAALEAAGVTPHQVSPGSRTNGQSYASGSSPSLEEPKPEPEGVKPPRAEGHPEGHKRPPIAPEPARAQASEGAQNGTLASLAARIETLAEERATMLTELDRIESDLRQLAELLRRNTEALIPFAETTPA